MTLTVGAVAELTGVGAGWRPEISGWVADRPGLRILRGDRRIARSRSSTSRGGGTAGAGCCRRPARHPALPGRNRPARSRQGHPPGRLRRGTARAAGQRAHRVLRGRRARGRAPAAAPPEPGRAGRARSERPPYPGRAGRAAGAGADRVVPRLAGGRVHRGRLPHRADRAHGRGAAVRRRQHLRQRDQQGPGPARHARPHAALPDRVRAHRGRVPSMRTIRASTTTPTSIRCPSRCWRCSASWSTAWAAHRPSCSNATGATHPPRS